MEKRRRRPQKRDNASWIYVVAGAAAVGAIAFFLMRDRDEPTKAGPPASASAITTARAELTAAEVAVVEEVCKSCHALPPPDALPRAAWAEAIAKMTDVPDSKVTAEQVTLATAHYEARAPLELAPLPQSSAIDGTLAFFKEEGTPRAFGPQRIPGTANVHFAPVRGERLDLIVSEMRSRSVSLVEAGKSRGDRVPRVIARELNYPVHSAVADMNDDGRADLVVASLGGMNPGNETKGSAAVLLQAEDGSFASKTVATALGRVADVRPADFDGDGDLDLTVAAFGWLGPGTLLVLRNDTTDWSQPKFTRFELDSRDGYIHTEIADLDGDGDLDFVALIAQEHEQVIAFVNQGGFEFVPEVLHQAPHPAWGSSGLQLVDMDGDGDMDVLVSNGDALDDKLLKPYHGVSWLENEGALRFEEHRIGALYGCERAVAADMDGDGDMDVVAVSFLPHLTRTRWRELDLDSVVWFEKTDAGWTKKALEKHAAHHPTVAVADYDQDGKPDIALGNFVWLNEDGTPFSHTAEALSLWTSGPGK